jgi:hypothetical protein
MVRTIQEIESTVIRKTNKYVYFNNGTHMTYSDFHKLKMDIRREYAAVIADDIKDSQLAVVEYQTDINQLRDILDELNREYVLLQTHINWLKELASQSEKPNFNLDNPQLN